METQSFPLLGTVSHGTMRPQDLIPAFIDAVDTLLDCRATSGKDSMHEVSDVGNHHELVGEIERRMDTLPDYFESEESDWDLETLFDILNSLAPQDYYFGAHVGDGSDYGFWSVEDL